MPEDWIATNIDSLYLSRDPNPSPKSAYDKRTLEKARPRAQRQAHCSCRHPPLASCSARRAALRCSSSFLRRRDLSKTGEESSSSKMPRADHWLLAANPGVDDCPIACKLNHSPALTLICTPDFGTIHPQGRARTPASSGRALPPFNTTPRTRGPLRFSASRKARIPIASLVAT
jgi:hypothetical protein